MINIVDYINHETCGERIIILKQKGTPYKKFMKKYVLAILLVLPTIKCLALDIFDVNERTPEMNSLIKCINNPVDYSRGLANITIPLYEIKSSGLTLPVTLSYYHGGLKVNEFSKWIGQGWSLNVEPTIVRTLRGSNDQQTTTFMPQDFKYDSLNNEGEKYDHCYSLSNGTKDEQPDLFNYKLLDRSGSFMLIKKTKNSPLTAVTIPYDPIKIEIVKSNVIRDIIQIQITDDNGNVYKFDVLEGSNDSYSPAYYTTSPKTINSWKCSSIKNEAGKVLFQFNYMNGNIDRNPVVSVQGVFEDNQDRGHLYPLYRETSRTDLPNNLIYGCKKSAMTWTRQYNTSDVFNGFYDISFSLGQDQNDTREVTLFPKRLKSVLFNNDSIVFDNTSNTYLSSISGLNKTIRFVNSLTEDISENNGIDDRCPFLDSIIISSSNNGLVESYVCEYNGPLPSKPFFSHLLDYVDFWGNLTTDTYTYLYSCGIKINYKTDPYRLTDPETIYDGSYESFLLFKGEKVTSDQGILKSIVNPAGCKTEFTFEPNCYEKILNSSSEHDYGIAYHLTPNNNMMNTGGLRIKQIDYSDPNGAKITRVFKYGKERQEGDRCINYSDKETGLGIIRRQIDPSCFTDNQKSFLYSSSNTGYANSITRLRTVYPTFKSNAGNPVVYDRVTEYITTANNQGAIVDNGKTVYTYNFSWNYRNVLTAYTNDNNEHYMDYQDDWMYGQLLSKQIFKRSTDSTYSPVARTDYEYTENVGPRDTVKAGICFPEYVFNINGNTQPDRTILNATVLSYFGIYLNQIYSYIRYPIYSGIKKISAEIDSSFTDNGVVVTRKDYTYGNRKHIYPTSINVTNSDGVLHNQNFTYPLDSVSSYLSQYSDHKIARDTLIKHRNISPVLEKTDKSGSSIIASTYNRYKIFPNYSAPLVYKQITELSSLGKQEQITCDKYDNYGNPVYLTKVDGVQTVYLWSYCGQYPIAVIENATYDQVKTALGYTTEDQINGLTANSNPDMTSIGTLLRSYFTSNSVLITTYTYKPFVGMTSKTDPRGITTYYDYGDFGWLKEVYQKDANNVKQIIQSYDYHYRK